MNLRFLALVAICGCAPSADEDVSGQPRPPWVELAYTLTTDADGGVDIPLDVADGDDALMVVAERDVGFLSVVSVTNPDGDIVLDGDDWTRSHRLTHAPFLAPTATTLNWPVRAEDGPLEPGRWTVRVAAWTEDDDPDPGVSLDVTTLTRRVPEAVVLPVFVAYAGGLEGDAHLAIAPATEEAVARWQEIYAQAGITLDVQYGKVDTDFLLPHAEDADWTGLYAEIDPRSVVVVVGVVIKDEVWLGQSPSIPGPFTSTPLSAVLVSGALLARDDGQFQDVELDTYAVTLAHEVGHYLGLFHPAQLVERSGDPPLTWDALADTPDCEDYDTCVAELSDNLMFPFPDCDAVGCVGGTALTPGQAAVLRGWIGVR